MVKNIQAIKQEVLYLVDRSYLVSPEIKEKIKAQIDELADDRLNNIYSILKEEVKKEKEFLIAHIQKNPEFFAQFSRFIAKQFQSKQKESETQARTHDDAELLDLEYQLQNL